MENRRNKRRRSSGGRQEPEQDGSREAVTAAPAEELPLETAEPVESPAEAAAEAGSQDSAAREDDGFVEFQDSGLPEPQIDDEALHVEPPAELLEEFAPHPAEPDTLDPDAQATAATASGWRRTEGPHQESRAGKIFRKYLEPVLHFKLPLPLSLLDRYILDSFFTPFVFIFLGFTGIRIIYDLQDNFEDFHKARTPIIDVLGFYVTQLPEFALLGLQVSLLLAILYSLSKLSRTHELVAMLSAGRSVPRLLVPIFVVGLLVTAICVGLSYSLAPWAAAEREAQFEALIRGEKRQSVLFGQLYRNRIDNRTWHVRRIPMGGGPANRVHILQQDGEGNSIFTMVVKDAEYLPATEEWFLDSVVMVFFDEEGNVINQEYRRRMHVRGWREKPKLIVGSNQNPEQMGVPELRQYLVDNADFPPNQLAPFRTYLHHRWAVPWVCMVVVLFGAPLGMAFSRGGVMSNAATAIFLFIGLILVQNIFLALGRGDRIDAWVAAWLPNIGLALYGLFLLWLRAGNRDLPKLNFYGLYTALTSGRERA